MMISGIYSSLIQLGKIKLWWQSRFDDCGLKFCLVFFFWTGVDIETVYLISISSIAVSSTCANGTSEFYSISNWSYPTNLRIENVR